MDLLTEPGPAVAVVEVLIGLFLLTRAADEFVEGAAGFARSMRISPVVIGAVIVGFGTSAPEMLVSGLAAADGNLDLGVGNVVGSNVANLTLVLGAAAMIVVLRVSPAVLAREAPLSLLAVLLFAYMTTGGLTRLEGVIMAVALVGALGWIISGARGPQQDGSLEAGLDDIDADDDDQSAAAQLARTALGLTGTIIGAQLMVWGATALAELAGLTGGFIGFTLVAIGTSLPELVTAVAAARLGQTELILGNLLGSNIFNSLAVGSFIALLGPGPINDRSVATIGVICMVAVAVMAWVFLVTRKRVHRIEAVVLLAVWLVALALMAGDARTEVETAITSVHGLVSAHGLVSVHDVVHAAVDIL